jgi:glycosyltransferase involved in cell wall biosynthesis
MSKRPRIPVLFVHHRSELGGAPASLSYLIRELDDERFEAHIYCPPGPAAELFRESGAHVHTGAVSGFTHIWASTYRGRRWLLFARELALLPQHVFQFRRELRRGRFELVHFNDSPLIPAAWLARHESLPVVWHLRSALPDGGRDRRSRFVRAAIRRLATTSIAINHDVANVFGVGSTVVANSVDLGRFRPGADEQAAKAALGLPPERPVVSYFGFIYPSKGFREFIEAAARLRERGVEARYLIVGGAVRGEEFFKTVVGRSLQLADLTRDYESEAKRLVDDLGLTEVVRFVPFTQDTANLYQASDVVVAPSQGPELGRPVIEAAASGVPVVAPRSGGAPDVVRSLETGLLYDPTESRGLARAVAAVAGDRHRALLGARGRELALARDWREAVDELVGHHYAPPAGGAPVAPYAA